MCMSASDLQRARTRLTAELRKDMDQVKMDNKMKFENSKVLQDEGIAIRLCGCCKQPRPPVLDNAVHEHSYIFCPECGKRTAIKDTAREAALQWNTLSKL